MSEPLVAALTLVAAVLFILSLGGLSRQSTARRGNVLGIIGMVLALGATAALVRGWGFALLVGAMAPAAIIGAIVARRVAMTAMPQLVALLHSFVGLAAVLVGVASSIEHAARAVPAARVDAIVHHVEVYVGACVGALTFTGSIAAFAKLQGLIGGSPMLLPGRHAINAGMLAAIVGLGWPVIAGDGSLGALIAGTVLAGVLGAHLVLAIGGADMPVVVSMLNSYSGWAAAAAGFMLSSDLLIITGALVGSSGAILSLIMCRGMNRSLIAVIMGGFGTGDGGASTAQAPAGEVRPITADETGDLLARAREVVIVPGYGMAVARAQHAIASIVEHLRGRGGRVRLAIHPVAGRLPGHMNVLLAEAGVPYDIVHELAEINPDFPSTDAVLVIGANDIVNPSAQTDPASPIAGMPVLEVWNARTVVVMKRGMATGYAGVENPLFFHDRTRMLFGDARSTAEAILARLRAGQA